MRTLVAALVAAAAAGGIAYAAIPDAAGVYHGCIHKNTGALRVIDSATQQCNANTERAITFNQQGPAGVAPSVAQLASGDSHCAAGGAAITDAAGSTAYVCNGTNGADGDSFDGTFTSPNGQYSLSVTDAGIQLTSNAGVQVGITGSTLDVAVGSDYELAVGRNLTASVGKNATVNVAERSATNVGLDATVSIGRALDLQTGSAAELDFGSAAIIQSAGTMSVKGATINLNGGTSCRGVARIGDSVSPTNVTTGSLTVCAGG
jgi:hypothetical protein